MRAKRKMIVVAYDISDDKRRNHVVKILEKAGVRVNYSVFECMLTDAQYEKLRNDILCELNLKEDTVAYYPICVDCYTKIVYQPASHRTYEKVSVI